MGFINIQEGGLGETVSRSGEVYSARARTLTEVAAYAKNGNSPADQICRSRFKPSGLENFCLSKVEHGAACYLLQVPPRHGCKHRAPVGERQSAERDLDIAQASSLQQVCGVSL